MKWFFCSCVSFRVYLFMPQKSITHLLQLSNKKTHSKFATIKNYLYLCFK